MMVSMQILALRNYMKARIVVNIGTAPGVPL